MGNSWRNLGAVLAAGKAAAAFAFEVVEEGRGVKITGASERRAVVLAVEYEVEPKQVRILRGENRGETERYRNVVRDLKLVGTWQDGELVVELPVRRSGLEVALLVQAGNGGHILGAVRV